MGCRARLAACARLPAQPEDVCSDLSTAKGHLVPLYNKETQAPPGLSLCRGCKVGSAALWSFLGSCRLSRKLRQLTCTSIMMTSEVNFTLVHAKLYNGVGCIWAISALASQTVQLCLLAL